MDAQNRAQFGRYVQSLRLQKRLTLRRLATEMGNVVGASYLSQIENGFKGPPSKQVLRALAQALEVPINEVFRRAGIEDEDPDQLYSGEDLDRAIRFVTSDRRFQFGGKIQSDLKPATKIYIIRLYEKAMGVQLLPDPQRKGLP